MQILESTRADVSRIIMVTRIESNLNQPSFRQFRFFSNAMKRMTTWGRSNAGEPSAHVPTQAKERNTCQ